MINTTFNTLQVLYHTSANIDDQATVEDTGDIGKYIINIIYTITILFGIAGNSLVIWVASFKLKPTVTNVWLVNLAVADLIFCVSHTIPLTKKLFFDYWPFGEFLCKSTGFFNYANMFCSVFLLSVISMDRALCIWHPLITKRRRTLCTARLVSGAVWLGAIILSAPYFFYRQLDMEKENQTSCTMKVKMNKDSVMLVLNWIRFLCGFLLPFLVILSCYILAGLGLRRTRLSRKSRPLRILVLLVLAFFLCWAPYHCFLLARWVNKDNNVLKDGVSVAKCFAYFNSCINPILYFCMGLRGSKFGQSLISVYKRALADDGDGRTNTEYNERTEYDTSGSGSQPAMLMINTTFNKLQVLYHTSANIDDQATVEDTGDIEKYIINIIYTITILFGIAGNSLVIWVASFKLKPTVTNVWLVNLAVADLIFCVSHTIKLIKKLFFDYWPFGLFLCKSTDFFNYANMFCSVFLLSVISMDRALCIWHPLITKRRRTLCTARLVSGAVWLGAIILSAPYFFYRDLDENKQNQTSCIMKVKKNKYSVKLVLNWVRFLCGFLLPFLVILSCYILAGLGLRRTRLSRKSRPLRILVLLVLAFFLCWAPYHCFLLARWVNKDNNVFKDGVSVAKCFAYFNSCINPILYFCMGLRGSKFGRSLIGVYQRALADDGDGRTDTQYNERIEYDTSGSGSQPGVLVSLTPAKVAND
ncbi:hypothetical protein UPYG_G00339840 [Umbra pygmaea]|uniref:G-protein coupled receptors family 1 profile domain-containing protein n=1 Tax=Umbra pygmaea TaxID=75934 RepID=A0ABD0WFC3_UMBPY